MSESVNPVKSANVDSIHVSRLDWCDSTEDFTDVTLASEDTNDYDDDHNNHKLIKIYENW